MRALLEPLVKPTTPATVPAPAEAYRDLKRVARQLRAKPPPAPGGREARRVVDAERLRMQYDRMAGLAAPHKLRPLRGLAAKSVRDWAPEPEPTPPPHFSRRPKKKE